MSNSKINVFSKNDSLGLKGIAIIIMMFHHLFLKANRFVKYGVIIAPFTQDAIVTFAGTLKICVSIFVFITGYGLYYSAKSKCTDGRLTGKWITDRCIKTFSGFWFVYIITFIVTFAFNKYPLDVYFENGTTRGLLYILIDFLGLFNLFDTPTLNGTWWYMSAALIFIVLIPFIVKLSQRFGYTAIILALVIIPRLLGIGYLGGSNTYSFLLMLIAGMIFAEYNVFEKIINFQITKNKFISEALQFILWTLVLALSIYLWIRLEKKTVWEYHYALQPLISIIYCRKYIIRIPVLKQVLSFIGKHSMNIFLIHSFFRKAFFDDFIFDAKYFWAITVYLLAVSLVVSIVIELLKKLLHYDKLISHICKKIVCCN